jgi:enamine deaminase RidA (YjgF/YER057c/UK114 family)
VIHVGDVRRQTARALENIGALLADGDAGFEHVTHFIVYLRDHSDYALVRGILEERFGDMPMVFVVAPVCRPGWLVELECLAVVPQERSEFAPF